MRFLRWGRCSSRKRKKPTSSRTKRVVLLKRVFTCVYACTTVESKLEWTRVRWRVVVVVLLRRARVLRFGGWCAQTIRERFFIDRSKRKDISRAQKRTRDENFSSERERERGFGESSNKKLFCCDFFDWWFQNFLFRFPFFPLLLLFFSTGCFYRQKEWKVWFELCFETASLKERQLLITHIKLWPKERNRREKPRNRYDQTERFSRVKMRRALTFCCPSFLRAFKRVYIYIYLMYKSRFPQFKGVSFPQFSHSRGD